MLTKAKMMGKLNNISTKENLRPSRDVKSKFDFLKVIFLQQTWAIFGE